MSQDPRLIGPFTVGSLLLDDGAELPSTPGIYVWRKILAYDSIEHGSRQEAERWILKQAEAPLAVFTELRVSTASSSDEVAIRNSFVLMKDMKVGAAHLEGKELLPSDGPPHNQVLELLSELMRQIGPVLYIGESNDIRARILAHAAGRTGLKSRLDEVGLGFRDVAVWYVEMASATYSSAARKQVEGLITHLAGAPFTRKAGA